MTWDQVFMAVVLIGWTGFVAAFVKAVKAGDKK